MLAQLSHAGCNTVTHIYCLRHISSLRRNRARSQRTRITGVFLKMVAGICVYVGLLACFISSSMCVSRGPQQRAEEGTYHAALPALPAPPFKSVRAD